ncbi:MAG: 3-phosphoserine/phosphohydroxythreonine transaminase [Sulfurospirillum sp.]|nr:MAG: 3-phosphoserine/phosphohydroxythreonine transaminase [Sulfurospirillum sp.]
MKRAYNFGAGPSALPTEVLEIAQKELLDYKGSGISIMEASHRSRLYDDVHQNAIGLVRKLYKLPDDFDVLFLQGGASLQFAMVPMNLYKGGKAEYANTGAWSKKAIKEAEIQGLNFDVVASSAESGFDHIPEVSFSDDCDFCHITSNNTIYGTQYQEYPKTASPLAIDASSDIFSREVDWERVGLMYAGAQKNAGPSGLTIVLIRKNLIDRVQESVPTMLRYKTHADANSLFNTPPTFGIYLLNLILQWIDAKGGIAKVDEENRKKAKLLYDAIDNSNGFYTGHARPDSRSLMNVSFNIREKDAALEAKLLEEAAKANMIGLKGHRSIGGLRASIYNAVPFEAVEALVDLMNDFAKRNA